MITKYKIFENNNTCDYCDIGESVFQQYYTDYYCCNYTPDEIYERIIDFCKSDFPYGLNNMKNKIILYRLLNVDDIKQINKQKLGKHYVGDKDMFNDTDFLYSSSILGGNDPIKKWFIVTIETNEENIDIERTLSNRAEYPDEYEYYLVSDFDMSIINIEEIDNSQYT